MAKFDGVTKEEISALAMRGLMASIFNRLTEAEVVLTYARDKKRENPEKSVDEILREYDEKVEAIQKSFRDYMDAQEIKFSDSTSGFQELSTVDIADLIIERINAGEL